MSWKLANDIVTVNTALTAPAFPSVTVTLLMLRTGKSSLMMVPTAWPRARVALTGLLNVSVNVSDGSIAASGTIGTRTSADVEPAGNVTVPEEAVKSVALAVPGAVS